MTSRMDMHDARPGASAARLALAVIPIAAVAALGSAATLPNIPGWYAALVKPPLTPPNAAFGPAWTVLYILMAVSVWRVLRLSRSTSGRGAALGAFAVQLALNGAWSWAFFAGRDPLAGIVVILLLVAAIVGTIRLFHGLDGTAAWLLVPYLAWVSYATYLNLGIVFLNR